VVSEWRKHGGEAVPPVCQRKDAEFVEDGLPVGNGGEKPVKVFPVNASREESDHTEEVAGIRAKFAERRRSE
jgi:hypothetical protein